MSKTLGNSTVNHGASLSGSLAKELICLFGFFFFWSIMYRGEEKPLDFPSL